MATVKIDQFGGVVPRQHPTLLKDGMAVTAHNCRLKSGKLVPLKEPSFVNASEHTVYMEGGIGKIADAKSLFCWKHTMANGSVRTDFLAFPNIVYFAHGNIADDSYDRVFVTGDNGVTWRDQLGNDYENAPCCYLFDRAANSIIRYPMLKDTMDAPRCSLSSTLDEDTIVYAYFFVSWVDKYGYESPCSDPSTNKNKNDDGTWPTTYSTDPLKVNSCCKVAFQPLTIPSDAEAVRIYKTNPGDTTDNIQFVKEFSKSELPSLKNSFTVSIDDTQLGETMPELEGVPSDLVDMTFVPGSFYAGRSRSMPHTVLFSDIDNPSNWALAYRYDIKDNVVKLAVTSNTVFALTDGYPYVFSGTAPESMTSSSLAGPAACVSERGVCVFKNAVFFVSNYGLYTIYNDADEGTLCKCLTEQFFTKAQWQALNPSSCVMGQFDGALHLFFNLTDGTYKSMIFDLTESACAITTHDEASTCLCTDDRSDDMYFVRVAGV